MRTHSIKDRIRLVVGLLLVAAANNVAGQIRDTVPDLTAGFETYQVDLETVLQLAGADNLTIKEFRARQDLARVEEKISKEWLLPDAFLGATLHHLSGSAMNADGRFFRDVDRNQMWGGARIGLSWIPGEGIYQTLAAKQNTLASGYLLQAKKNETILGAILVFYDLQEKQAEYKTLVNLLNYSDRISKQLKIQVDNGQQYRSEYLLARSNYNNTLVALQEVIKNVHNISAKLIETLNIEDEDILLLSSVNEIVPIELLDELMISADLYDTAYARRPELQYYQNLIEARKFDQKRLSTGLLIPQLSVGFNQGSVGPFNGVPNNNPTDFNAKYEGTFEVNAVVGWSIPLDLLISGGRRKKVSTLIQLHQNQQEQQKILIKRELSQALSDYRESKNQLEIAKESAQFAEEALKQSTERQKLGTAKPFEVFQAQEIYLKTMISYQSVVKNYNKAQYQLYVALGNDL
jgi:outer membrane protein TolC